jgi:hypothetical protein
VQPDMVHMPDAVHPRVLHLRRRGFTCKLSDFGLVKLMVGRATSLPGYWFKTATRAAGVSQLTVSFLCPFCHPQVEDPTTGRCVRCSWRWQCWLHWDAKASTW